MSDEDEFVELDSDYVPEGAAQNIDDPNDGFPADSEDEEDGNPGYDPNDGFPSDSDDEEDGNPDYVPSNSSSVNSGNGNNEYPPEDNDPVGDAQSFVTPQGSVSDPTVSLPKITNPAPAILPEHDEDDSKKKKRVRIYVLIGVVVVLIIAVIGYYKYVNRPATPLYPTQQSQQTVTPQAPPTVALKSNDTSSTSGSSDMELENAAPNIKSVYQATGFIKEKNIYKYGSQRLYELKFQVSNVQTPLSVFVPADTYSNAQDGDKYQVVYGEYEDGVIGIRSLSKVTEN